MRVTITCFRLGLSSESRPTYRFRVRSDWHPKRFPRLFIGAASLDNAVEMFGSVRGRVGYVANDWLYYVTGGLAWTYDQFTRTQLSDNPTSGARRDGRQLVSQPQSDGRPAPASRRRSPPTGRCDWNTFTPNMAILTWRLRARRNGSTSICPCNRSGGAKLQVRRQWIEPNRFSDGAEPLGERRWSLHGQTTFAGQYAAPFRARIAVPIALIQNAGRETWDATLYIGRRLWEGAELWVNPEMDQGFGLSDTHGIAGFPNGNAYKVGADDPYMRLPCAPSVNLIPQRRYRERQIGP